MKLSIPKIKKNEQLFFLAYIIFMIFSVLMHSLYYQYYAGIYKYIAGVCILLLLSQEIINKSLSYRALAGAIILYLAALLLVIQGTGNVQTSFACVFVFAFGARSIDFKKICGITISLTLTLIFFVIVSSLLGIIENYHVIQNLQGGEIRSRYFLGFRYALNAPAMLCNVILLYVYQKREKAKVLEIAFLFVFSLILYEFTNSRLTFYTSIIGLIIAIICKIRKDNLENLQKVPKILIPSFLVCFGISIWLAISYSPSVTWMQELNAFLSNRLRHGQNSFMMYGVSLFGLGNIEWVGAGLDVYGRQSTETYFYVDNLYIQVLQRYGIIFMAIFLALTTALMIQCYKKKENLLVILLAIIAFHGLIDDGIMYLQLNTFWLLFGPAVFGYIRSRSVVREKNRHAGMRRAV